MARRKRESDAEWGSYGYDNVWGGFHQTTDASAYWTFLRELLRHPGLLWGRAMLRMARDRWRHRRCDTVDFHHYACTLDPFGKQLEADYQWARHWRDHPKAVAARAAARPTENEPDPV